jgi:hypothetical protein
MESKALFGKLLSNTKNNHTKKFIQIQMNKASVNEPKSNIYYRNSLTLVKLAEESTKLHFMKYNYSPAKKLSRKEQVAREAALVGLGLPKVRGSEKIKE